MTQSKLETTLHETISVRVVRVLYFAAARQRVGFSEEKLEVSFPYHLTTLQQSIYQHHPALLDLTPYLRWAINQKFVDGDPELTSGDEVALIPPISGG